jgi:hypothetical protein
MSCDGAKSWWLPSYARARQPSFLASALMTALLLSGASCVKCEEEEEGGEEEEEEEEREKKNKYFWQYPEKMRATAKASLRRRTVQATCLRTWPRPSSLALTELQRSYPSSSTSKRLGWVVGNQNTFGLLLFISK